MQTHVSIHQMLKGFIVIFTMIYSIILFNRTYNSSQKLGIFNVVAGLLIVGSSNLSSYNPRCKYKV